MDELLRKSSIEALALSGVSDDVADKVLVTVGNRILQILFLKITDTLSDEKLEEFEDVMNMQDKDTIFAFLVENVPDLDILIQESSKKVVEEYKKL